MDEFTKNPISEYSEAQEFENIRDNPVVPEYAVYDEIKTFEEMPDPEGVRTDTGINKEKKNRALASMSTGVVSAIAAVTVGITTLLNVNMAAEFKSVDYMDGRIAYEVSVEDMTEKETLTAYLYDGEDLITSVDLKDDDGDGIIQGFIDLDSEEVNQKLDSDEDGILNYRLNLNAMVGLDVERKFDSYVVEISKMSSSFEDITGECHCGVDGCYHFKMNFTDDLGVFDNFEAKIEDSFGNVAECTFTDNLHEEQKIFVGDLKGSAATLIVTYTAEEKTETVKIDIKM